MVGVPTADPRPEPETMRDHAGDPPRGPLAGWRVLVPRAPHQAGELSRQLRRHGATPWEVATIETVPPDDPAPMDRAAARLVGGEFAWTVFTSVNTVQAVVRALEARGADARGIASRVAAVGDRTAEALDRLGVRVDLLPGGEQSAEGLLESWPPLREGEPRRVFLPRSDLARHLLEDELNARGWDCEAVTAYRTAPVRPPAEAITAIEKGEVDAVVFTSSSTVRHLLRYAVPPPSTVVAAIGRQTAKTAREHGLHVHTVARKPSAAELADALAEYAAQMPGRKTT